MMASHEQGFKFLWYTMQHSLQEMDCRSRSEGVECVWQDPSGQLNEEQWQLLLHRISITPQGLNILKSMV